MPDRRQANVGWYVADDTGVVWQTVKDGAILATLMDIRDELRGIRNLLNCPNALGMPWTLKSIEKNTRRKRVAKTKRRAA